jgi:hypothetical protein
LKKTFALTHPKLPVARVVEAIKHEVKKYIKRERNKHVPKGMNFWDFDCRFGHTEETATALRISEINKSIDEAVKLELTSFYLEILAKPGHKVIKDKNEEVVIDEEDKPE